MTPVTCFAGKSVALFGLGGSGRATARALKAGGATVTCFDDSAATLAAAKADGHHVEDLRGADWSGFSALVLTPGVPLTHPMPHWSAAMAHAAGVEVIGDVELFCRERAEIAPRAPFVAITGTNGKSTTTALTAHLLQAFGMQVEMGGNIGTPILDLEPPSPQRTHVIEVSSYQIDLTPSLRPSIGVLLNLTPDHIDRHGTMENYAAVKERLVAQADLAIVAVDDAYCLAVAERLRQARKPGTTVSITHPDLAEGIVLDGTRLVRHVQGRSLPIADLAGIASLRGKHNAQNAAAAVAALGGHAYAAEIVQAALRSFPGLPHRMEQVGTRRDVIFVNDSKATNADAAEKALLSFEHIFWIIGGQAKDGGIAPLKPLFPRVEKAFLIGEASDAFAHTLEGVRPYERCGTLDVALERAATCAETSGLAAPVVLLSPACASFDQFPNFGARGDAFRSLVQGLPGMNESSARNPLSPPAGRGLG